MPACPCSNGRFERHTLEVLKMRDEPVAGEPGKQKRRRKRAQVGPDLSDGQCSLVLGFSWLASVEALCVPKVNGLPKVNGW
mmetsp:Transcript_53825/g.166786  ORF Transcript_53825/g.166786 Transcript_53825/m.166786 type:complete len:81 (-) Transcript_53825:640-882(-)